LILTNSETGGEVMLFSISISSAGYSLSQRELISQRGGDYCLDIKLGMIKLANELLQSRAKPVTPSTFARTQF
jgi:hypothetical protein